MMLWNTDGGKEVGDEKRPEERPFLERRLYGVTISDIYRELPTCV
jgi:hypothetical protein